MYIIGVTKKLYFYLKISSFTNTLEKLVQACITLTSHSFEPERTITCHTILNISKQSYNLRVVINNYMCLVLISTGIINFVPKLIVGRFIKK